VVDGIFRRASMAENYVIKAKALDSTIADTYAKEGVRR